MSTMTSPLLCAKVECSDNCLGYTTFSVSWFRYVEDDEIGFEKSLALSVFV